MKRASEQQVATNAEFGFLVNRRAMQGPMPKAHTHPEIEINVVLQGGITYLHSGRLFSLPENSINVFWADLPHQTLDTEPDTEVIWVLIPLAWFLGWQLPGQLQSRIISGDIATQSCNAHDRALFDQWHEDFNAHDDEKLKTVILECEARLRRFSLTTSGSSGKAPSSSQHIPDSIAKAISFIHESYSEDISVDDIASHVNLHPKYFLRAFKKHLYVNVWQYLTQLRIAKAQLLLITTQEKVTNIAMQSGFHSSSAFYEAFGKSQKGMTPNQYRKQFLNTKGLRSA